MSKKQQTPKIKSLQVGFSIIDYVARSLNPVKFNDIHHETKITKSNLYKYLNTLTALGILYRDEETGLFSGGTTLIEYGMASVNNNNVLEKVTPYLEQISIYSGETTLLTTWTNNGPMIIKMIDSRAGLNLGGQVGTILPINTAGGKLYGAYMDGPLVEQWIHDETKDFSKKTLQQLHEDFKIIRHSGIAFAHEALAPSVQSAAIPFFDYTNQIIGAIVIVGFENTIPKSPESELSVQLLELSKKISAIFGYSENH